MAITNNIRNVCLLGHGGNGKTSLAEAMLYLSKGSERLGKVVDGNTVSDYDPEEIKRKFSISASVIPVMWNDVKINIIDTPGYLDYAGEVVQGLRAAGMGLIVIDAKSGADVGSELAWQRAEDYRVPKAFFINKMDDESADFASTVQSLRDKFGVAACPIIYPLIEDRKVFGFVNMLSGKAHKYFESGGREEIAIPDKFKEKLADFDNMLNESLAETSDELMEKFFGGEEFTVEEKYDALNKGIMQGVIAPILMGSATTLAGIEPLLNVIAKSFPNPLHKGFEQGSSREIPINTDGKAAIFVFKTVADPFGKITFFKVMNGTLKKDMTLYNISNGSQEKFSRIFTIKGKKQTEVDELCCGDIGVTTKLAFTSTNETLSEDKDWPKYTKVMYPTPYMCVAVNPKAKGDEDKISSGIAKLKEEDHTMRYENNSETKQLLLYGMGEQHLDVILSKLSSRYGVSLEFTKPKIAYRETLKKSVDAEGKYKKQSGGHGQYGHVKIQFSPGEDEGLTFTESTVGGSVPKNFHPAVEKGLLESMAKGVLAGYPMVGLKANLYDGSFHDVDSSEMSFKVAASLAYKDGIPRANPVLLEPVGDLKIYVSDEYTGDIYGDISKRRGRILGMSPSAKRGINCIEAEVPQAEMDNYTVTLRALTQGRGTYSYEFVRYEEVPQNIAQKIIAEAKVDEAE